MRFRGKFLGSLKPGARRRTIGLASAMTPLLPGSLGMNLRYRAPDAPAEDLDRLIEDCGLKQLVARLPRGLDYVLASGGVQLSLGERQSVMLARALLGTPPVLLLDSIDSHLEPAVIARLADRIRSWPGVVLGLARNRANYVDLGVARATKTISMVLLVRVSAAEAAAFDAEWADMTAHPGSFHLLGWNCSTHASQAFRKAGILSGGIPGLDTPNNLYRQLCFEKKGKTSAGAGYVGFTPFTTGYMLTLEPVSP